MAHVTFNPNQPIQSLSGTIGRNTFRTVDGQTYMTRRLPPVLPKNPTRQQRARFRQLDVIDKCVICIQAEIHDLRDAIEMRPLIRSRIVRLYKRLAPTIKAPSKLQKAILSEYAQKFCKTSPSHSREIPETKSRLSP